MYIKSQTKTTLVNTDHVSAYTVLRSVGREITWDVWAYTQGIKIVLGTYKSEENARFVMESLTLAVTGTTHPIFFVPPDFDETELRNLRRDIDGKENTDSDSGPGARKI